MRRTSEAMRLPLAVAALAFVATGCVHDQVRRRAAFDLNCPETTVEVVTITANSYGATGCGKRASYVTAVGVGVVLNSPVQQDDAPAVDAGAAP